MPKHEAPVRWQDMPTLAERLTSVLSQLEDIFTDADDAGWKAVAHKIEDSFATIENARLAALQYESGELEA